MNQIDKVEGTYSLLLPSFSLLTISAFLYFNDELDLKVSTNAKDDSCVMCSTVAMQRSREGKCVAW
jgi:hypothetical protein